MRDTSWAAAISETKAIAWLLEQGFDVFKNVRACGPADLVAINSDGAVFRIDVKTYRWRLNPSGQKIYQYGGSKLKLGICYLGYCPDDGQFTWLDGYRNASAVPKPYAPNAEREGF